MGDLVHMDASVKKRLETIVDSKNLTMVSIYGQQPVSVEEMWAWCEKYSAVCPLHLRCRPVPGRGRRRLARRSCSRLSWVLCVTSTSASTPTPPPPTPCLLTPPSALAFRAIRAEPLHRHHEGLLLLCRRGPPLTTELAMTEEEKNVLRDHGHEYGAATGRPRRVSPLTPLPAATAYSARAAMSWP